MYFNYLLECPFDDLVIKKVFNEDLKFTIAFSLLNEKRALATKPTHDICTSKYVH